MGEAIAYVVSGKAAFFFLLGVFMCVFVYNNDYFCGIYEKLPDYNHPFHHHYYVYYYYYYYSGMYGDLNTLGAGNAILIILQLFAAGEE